MIAALRRVAAAVSVAAAQNFRAGLRAFLRFCFTEGIVDIDLSGAALAVTGGDDGAAPRDRARARLRALLASCDRRTALGRRDHAMLVVLLRLGLRAGEVARLRLDDLDWRVGRARRPWQGRAPRSAASARRGGRGDHRLSATRTTEK